MYTVIKRMEISASHSLKLSYRSKCENLHGHNWIITVYCRSEVLNEDGMVVDFTHIKETVMGRLDHQNLNEVVSLNPTAENIARWYVSKFPLVSRLKSASQKEIPLSMRRINEIFYSLQGEGYHTGIPAVFVRFSGCNLRCPFCDTQHEEGTLMSDEDIAMEVAKYSTQVVILTGGEPGLWIDEKLVDALHHERKYVCIETNGTCRLPENIDWVTCSPKEGAKINLDRIDEVKVVYVGQDVSAYLDLSASHYFLQPCSCANTEEVIAYILQHPEWRLSLQTHKLLQIP